MKASAASVMQDAPFSFASLDPLKALEVIEQEVRRFLRYYPPSDIEDVRSVAFGNFWDCVSNWRNCSISWKFIRTIARNCCVDLWRLRKNLRELPLPSTEFARPFYDDFAASTDPSPEEILLQKHRAAIVFGAIDRLRPNDRALCMLTFVEDHTDAETAELLGISVPTVRRRRHRVRNRLLRYLSEEDF